jgi:hypothetical protein
MYDREQALDDAPLSDLLVILLRQYKRLLSERGIELTEAAIQTLAHQLAEGAPPPEPSQSIRAVLIDMVEESIAVLARRNMTFVQSLETDMADVPGWTTTSEFLEIANEKGNAELRIASASALLAALGDLRYAEYLLAAITHEPHEIETAAGKQILAQASGIIANARGWPNLVRDWLKQRNT